MAIGFNDALTPVMSDRFEVRFMPVRLWPRAEVLMQLRHADIGISRTAGTA